MARRRKNDDDWIGLVVQIALGIFLLSLISPQVRQVISALGFIAICLLALAVACLIGFLIYRIATKSKRAQAVERNDFAVVAKKEEPTMRPTQRREYAAGLMVRESEPKKEELTPSKLLEKLRAIDWFQFEKLVAKIYGNLGYSVERRGGANADGGIDLIIEKEGQKTAIQM